MPSAPRVLVLSNPSDPHAFAVEAGLRVKGIRTQIWHTADWPTLQLGSFEFSDSEVSFELQGPEVSLRREDVTTLWLRRPLPPVLPGNLEASDYEFALRENALFLRSLKDLVGRQAFVVNPPASQHLTILRSAQLMSAAKAGFRIPRTLCANEVERVREFVRRTPQGVIFKSFAPMSWITEGGKAILFTSRVRLEDLSDDQSLKVCPGIFQELVPKAYEVRVTAMGKRLFAAKIRSQENEKAQLDYRAALDEISIEPLELPAPVALACLRVLTDLGIVFGCFDLIVTPAGDYVFLEVNEMGAFLWVEERLPELRLLDAFCEFLAQGRVDFRWNRAHATVRAEDVADAVEAQLERAPTLHLLPQKRTAIDPT